VHEIKKYNHALRRTKFPQCAPANLETSCLLEIGDISRKLRFRCGFQFPWCALALNHRENFISCLYSKLFDDEGKETASNSPKLPQLVREGEL
jgi:hypothetical protein